MPAPGPTALIDRAAAALRLGGLVAFPTETVYGLGADALNPFAVAAVFALKGRPAHNPLIVHVTGPDMARQLAADWPPWAETLARAFWPGPLTIVLPASPRVPHAVRAGGPTVALRAPAHPVAQALLAAFGGPLVGPSANPSGFVSPTTAEHVRAGFPDAVADGDLIVLDGGPCRAGIESTVVAISPDGTLRVLRPGVIGPSELAAALGLPADRVVSAPQHTDDAAAASAPGHAPLASPGQLASHYAPRAPAVLVSRDQWPALLASLPTDHRRSIALLARGAWPGSGAARQVTLPDEPAGYAAGLYAALRELDALAPSLIAIEAPPAPPPAGSTPSLAGAGARDAELWRAVADRLARATATPTLPPSSTPTAAPAPPRTTPAG